MKIVYKISLDKSGFEYIKPYFFVLGLEKLQRVNYPFKTNISILFSKYLINVLSLFSENRKKVKPDAKLATPSFKSVKLK